jgi:hypothetical protein
MIKLHSPPIGYGIDFGIRRGSASHAARSRSDDRLRDRRRLCDGAHRRRWMAEVGNYRRCGGIDASDEGSVHFGFLIASGTLGGFGAL